MQRIAPGVDLQRDILDKMVFAPVIKNPQRVARAELFALFASQQRAAYC
jgi:acyl CoA:acetate/3-ketoacid CoA transferase